MYTVLQKKESQNVFVTRIFYKTWPESAKVSYIDDLIDDAVLQL